MMCRVVRIWLEPGREARYFEVYLLLRGDGVLYEARRIFSCN